MQGLVLVVLLSVTVLVGTTLGRRWDVAPPVLLIVLGALLGLAPALMRVHLQPNLVLLLFLPPILYYESMSTSLREARNNLRVIILAAVVLVIVSAVAVSYAAQALGVDSTSAWILGAVLAPTDAAAVAGLAKRMPRRTLTTLHSESLINDGTALVLFAVATDRLDGHVPSAAGVVGLFAWSSVVGVAVGLAVAYATIPIRRRVTDPLRNGSLSVLTPFVAFLLAELAHASGVLAVVVAGLVLAHVNVTIVTPRARVETQAFWNLSTFLLNGGLFVFVGIQIPQAVRGLDSTTLSRASVIAVAVTAVVILTRMAWVHVVTWVIRAVDRRAIQRTRRAGWRVRTAIGWAGFRGAVSLAAALAVPATVHGRPFVGRDLIVFVTAVVILLTMLVQGITLPAVVRWAGLQGDDARDDELRQAQLDATGAALQALPELAGEAGADDDLTTRLRAEYKQKLHALRAGEDGEEPARLLATERRLRLALLERKRAAATGLRNRNQIDDIVLRQLLSQLDLEEIRLQEADGDDED